MVAEIVSLAMEYYRNPLGYRQLTDPTRPLCKPCEGLVDALGTALGPSNVQATAAGLGTTPEYLEEAARFFVRQVLLVPGSDPYRVLGLPPGAAEQKIRRHYHFLAGMFHPDRSPSDLERSTSIMARINEAYDALRTPQGRQAYSRDLAETGTTDSVVDVPAAASSPAYSPPPPGFTAAPEVDLRPRRSAFTVIAWVTLALVGTLVAAVIVEAINSPQLRVRGDGPQVSAPTPSFLQGDQQARGVPSEVEAIEAAPALSAPFPPAAQGDLQGGKAFPMEQYPAAADMDPTDSGAGDTDSPLATGATTVAANTPAPAPRNPALARAISSQRTRSVSDAARDFLRREAESANRTYRHLASTPPTRASRTPPRPKSHQAPPPKDPPKPKATTPKPTPKAAPPSVNPKQANGVVARLAACYKKGNLGCLAGLFTADAQVNDGSGTAFIRADYGDFFKRTSGRRLSVRKLRWSALKKGKVAGTGAFTARTKDNGASDWQSQSGTIQFELLRSGGSYKISKMIYSYGR